MPTIINGNTGVDQVTNNTLVVADAKTGEVVGFQKMQLFAAKATTSGTFVDFSPADGTGIPSWAKKITVMLNGVSTNGTSSMQIQLGTSGGMEVSGYSSGSAGGNNALVSASSTTGGILTPGSIAGVFYSGAAVIGSLGGNNWAQSSSLGGAGSLSYGMCGGSTKTLSGTLDRIRLTTVNGTDTFDAGSVSILVEGYE